MLFYLSPRRHYILILTTKLLQLLETFHATQSHNMFLVEENCFLTVRFCVFDGKREKDRSVRRLISVVNQEDCAP